MLWVLPQLEGFGLLRWIREPLYARVGPPDEGWSLDALPDYGWSQGALTPFVTVRWEVADRPLRWVELPPSRGGELLQKVAETSFMLGLWRLEVGSFDRRNSLMYAQAVYAAGLSHLQSPESRALFHGYRIELVRLLFDALHAHVVDRAWLLERIILFTTVRMLHFPAPASWMTRRELETLWMELLGAEVPLPRFPHPWTPDSE